MLIVAISLIVMSLVFHEMGHWAILYRKKIPVVEYGIGLGPELFKLGKVSFRLFPVGGFVSPDPLSWSSVSPFCRGLVAVGGPFFSILYGFCLQAAAQLFEGGPRLGLTQLAHLNYLLAFVNLIPVPPLDGWQILCSYLEMKGRGLSGQVKMWADRLGQGLVYGVGFFVIGGLFL